MIFGPRRRDEHERDRVRKLTNARLERRVALHELEELRDQEEHPERAQEDGRDAGRAGRERPDAEQTWVEDRVLDRELVTHPREPGDHEGDEAGDRRGMRPSELGTFDDGEHQADERDHG